MCNPAGAAGHVAPWLVTGAAGMLGRDVLDQLNRKAGRCAIGFDRAALDITEPESIDAVFATHRPRVVINCAAYTAVEDSEAHESEALRINGDGPRRLAEACARYDARLIHVSTDYVFSGEARVPYRECDLPAPGTAYGRTKLARERAVLTVLPNSGTVVRTAWLYGAHGRNFVRTMIETEARRSVVDVVDDQYGQPSWSADVAERIVMLGGRPDAMGIFHATNAGKASWHEFASEIFRLAGADPARVRATNWAACRGPAPRPAYTVLAHDRWIKFGVRPMRDWRSALRSFLNEAR